VHASCMSVCVRVKGVCTCGAEKWMSMLPMTHKNSEAVMTFIRLLPSNVVICGLLLDQKAPALPVGVRGLWQIFLCFRRIKIPLGTRNRCISLSLSLSSGTSFAATGTAVTRLVSDSSARAYCLTGMVPDEENGKAFKSWRGALLQCNTDILWDVNLKSSLNRGHFLTLSTTCAVVLEIWI
jgi:hypothetical protein